MIAIFLLTLIFAVSYLKDTFILNFFEGDFFISRKLHGFKWGTVGYDYTNLNNLTRFYSGLAYVFLYLICSLLLIWTLFLNRQFILLFLGIYSFTAIFSLIAFGIYKVWLWDGYFIAGTRLKELITSPMYILVTLIVFYITNQKSPKS